jgi:hypothetical protein
MSYEDQRSGYPRAAGAGALVRLTEDDVLLAPIESATIRFGCGHDAPERYALSVKAGRETLALEIDPKNEHYRDACGDCRRAEVIATAIRCSGCPLPILLGQGVTTMRGGVKCLSCTDPMQIEGDWAGTHVKPIKISLIGQPSDFHPRRGGSGSGGSGGGFVF